MKSKSLCLMYALGGALVGAAIAMLTTPHTGKELRGRIRDAVNSAAAEACHCHCHDAAAGGATMNDATHE